MAETKSSIFPAELKILHTILSWVCDQISQLDFTPMQIRKIEIALEEALVNIIQYAYRSHPGTIEVICKVTPADCLEIILKDYGIPFNPLQNGGKVNRSATLEERKEGGLGISFMQELMDKIEYRREGDANILILKKNIGS